MFGEKYWEFIMSDFKMEAFNLCLHNFMLYACTGDYHLTKNKFTGAKKYISVVHASFREYLDSL